MKKLYLFAAFAALLLHLKGQNLVPNPSFETYTGAGNSAISNGFVPSWNRPPGSIITPDQFSPTASSGGSCTDFNTANNCVGSSAAFHGAAYAGFLWYYTGCPNCKEYIQAALSPFPVSGVIYRASYRTKLGSLCRYGTNRHGLYISATAPSQPGGNQPILITPTVELTAQVLDKVNWTPVSGTFTSNGLERYITIGNFYNDASTNIFNFGASAGSCIFATGAAYYYIDSVVVIPAVVLPVQVMEFAGAVTPSGNALEWSLESDITLRSLWLEHSRDGNRFTPIAEFPGTNQGSLSYLHTLAPQGENYYRVGYEDENGNFNVSEVVVLQNDGFDSRAEALIYPNPSEGESLLEVRFSAPQTGEASVQVMDAQGRIVREATVPLEGDYLAIRLDAIEFAQGVYHVQVRTGGTSALVRWVVLE